MLLSKRFGIGYSSAGGRVPVQLFCLVSFYWFMEYVHRYSIVPGVKVVPWHSMTSDQMDDILLIRQFFNNEIMENLLWMKLSSAIRPVTMRPIDSARPDNLDEHPRYVVDSGDMNNIPDVYDGDEYSFESEDKFDRNLDPDHYTCSADNHQLAYDNLTLVRNEIPDYLRSLADENVCVCCERCLLDTGDDGFDATHLEGRWGPIDRERYSPVCILEACGHKIHKICLQIRLAKGLENCPVCGVSIETEGRNNPNILEKRTGKKFSIHEIIEEYNGESIQVEEHHDDMNENVRQGSGDQRVVNNMGGTNAESTPTIDRTATPATTATPLVVVDLSVSPLDDNNVGSIDLSTNMGVREETMDSAQPVPKREDDGRVIDLTDSPPTPRVSDPQQCAICLGTSTSDCFVEGCVHYFCRTCIARWIDPRGRTTNASDKCPACRETVRTLTYFNPMNRIIERKNVSAVDHVNAYRSEVNRSVACGRCVVCHTRANCSSESCNHQFCRYCMYQRKEFSERGGLHRLPPNCPECQDEIVRVTLFQGHSGVVEDVGIHINDVTPEILGIRRTTSTNNREWGSFSNLPNPLINREQERNPRVDSTARSSASGRATAVSPTTTWGARGTIVDRGVSGTGRSNPGSVVQGMNESQSGTDATCGVRSTTASEGVAANSSHTSAVSVVSIPRSTNGWGARPVVAQGGTAVAQSTNGWGARPTVAGGGTTVVSHSTNGWGARPVVAQGGTAAVSQSTNGWGARPVVAGGGTTAESWSTNGWRARPAVAGGGTTAVSQSTNGWGLILLLNKNGILEWIRMLDLTQVEGLLLFLQQPLGEHVVLLLIEVFLVLGVPILVRWYRV